MPELFLFLAHELSLTSPTLFYILPNHLYKNFLVF